MAEWKKVKLDELWKESKIESTRPDSNKRIKVKLNVQGVEKRPDKDDQKGATKYFIRKSGQFIYGKQNFHKGAFGIIPPELNNFESSSDIPAFDVDSQCNSEWIYYFFKQGDLYKQLEKYSKGTGSKRIHPDKIGHLEIPLPSKKEQDRILNELKQQERMVSEIFIINNKNESYISKLREQILQEAVQGKLVTQNLNDEPASELFKKIKSEKDKLIKEGKIKKEKSLPPITDIEKPYDLPKGWEWVRLGDMCTKIGSGSTPRGGKEVYKTSGIIFIRSQNVYNEGLILSNVAYIDKSTNEKMNGTKVLPNDLLLNITGGSIGRCALVPAKFEDANVSQHVTIIRTISSINRSFIHKLITSPYFQNYIMAVQNGANREGLAKKNMELMLIPLPPLSEQKRIVEKVDKLMVYCDELEKQVKENQENSEKLMEAVLKKSFENDQRPLSS